MLKQVNIKVITNRKLCSEPLENRIEGICRESQDKPIKGIFSLESIVLREKDLSEVEYEELYLSVDKICENYNVKLFPHYYWKLCIKRNINRIHLPLHILEKIQFDVDRNQFYDIVKEIGVSVHDENEARKAFELGATYVTFGHVFKTDCKKGATPRGVELLKKVSDVIDIPVFAIGGIDENNYNLAIENGAKGICMMSGMMIAK